MLIPLSCDSPVYHWPYATIGLIAANVLAFVPFQMLWHSESPASAELLYWLVLVHGDLNPVQWVTSMFAHIDILHLVGNMVFLWVFGLIVEGKVGWLKFLAIYMGIGILQSAIQQIGTLGVSQPSIALGASSAIAGAMAISLIWAPKNEIHCFYWITFFFVGTVDIAVMVFAFIYMAFDLLYLAVSITNSGSPMGTGLLHLMGTMLGLVVGVVMVKGNLVDCEGWDLFSVWNGADPDKEPDYAKLDAEVAKRKQAKAAQQQQDAHQQFLIYLKEGNVRGAASLYNKLRHHEGAFELDRNELIALIRGLHDRKEWELSAPFMHQLVTRFPEGTESVALKLAQICVTAIEKPARALEVLGTTNLAKLSPEKQQLAKKIAHKAHQLQAEGVYELDDESW